MDFSRMRAYSTKSNHVALEDYVRNEQCISKSVYSENRSQESHCGNRQRAKDRKNDKSEMKDRLTTMVYARQDKHRHIPYKLTKSIDKVRKDNDRKGTKVSTQIPTKILRPSELERESDELLKSIVQKQRILKDLDKRIEAKMSEWLIFQAEVNRKMTSYSNELSNIANLVQTEKVDLNSLRIKVAQTQQVFNIRCAQIAKRKQQVEDLCKLVEQTTKEQDLVKVQLEAQKAAYKAKIAQFDTIRLELQQKQMSLEQTSKKIHNYEEQILQSMAALQRRQRQIVNRQNQLNQFSQKHTSKEIQLDQRQKVISAYVSQLNNCISTLTVERSSLLNINANLQRRCNQLQTLQIKLFRKMTDEQSNCQQFQKYLTDSTNIQSRTPVRRNKQNMITFTQKKKHKSPHPNTIEQHSGDLLSESPLRFDFGKLS